MSHADEYIIDRILPANEFHLIAGPSGAGKTTWWLQAITAWSRGEPIFGYASNPKPFIYISLDRGKESIERTFRRVGVDPRSFPCLAGLDLNVPPQSFDQLVDVVLAVHPEVKLFLIDGIGTLAPAGNRADYGGISHFVSGISRTTHRRQITAWASLHSPKTKERDRYLNPRQRVHGSVAWAAYSETIVLVEPDDDDPEHLRQLYILPRNAPEQRFTMALDNSGLLIPAPPKTKPTPKVTSSELLDVWLSGLTDGEEFMVDELLGKMLSMASRSSIFNWLQDQHATGKLIRSGKGRYRKAGALPNA